jgi:hypothetical protein
MILLLDPNSYFTQTEPEIRKISRFGPLKLGGIFAVRGFQQINPSYPMVKELTRLY